MAIEVNKDLRELETAVTPGRERCLLDFVAVRIFTSARTLDPAGRRWNLTVFSLHPDHITAEHYHYNCRLFTCEANYYQVQVLVN